MWKSGYRESRWEEVILSRLRTGTPLFKVKHHIDANSPVDLCPVCNIRINLYLLFITCPHFSRYRDEILYTLELNDSSVSMTSLLHDSFPVDVLIRYLKSVDYYRKI